MSEISNITLQKYSFIIIKICSNHSKYDYLLVSSDRIISKMATNKTKSETKLILLTKDLSCGDCHIKRIIIPKLYVDGILVHYFVQELKISLSYRKSFINKINNSGNKMILQLVPAKKEIIDYAWNKRTTYLAWERVEIDHALSWLSTLGGAFSALGDYFSNCALIAGKISVHQLKLALRLGDPTIAARCRLFFSLSLIQRGHLKLAKSIIYKEYISAKNSVVIDLRLVRMCLGIWAKLKYEFSKRKKYKI